MEGVRLHDLRHSFALLQLSAGVHFMQVSQWLGHATYSLTLDVMAAISHKQMAACPMPPGASARPGEVWRRGEFAWDAGGLIIALQK